MNGVLDEIAQTVDQLRATRDGRLIEQGDVQIVVVLVVVFIAVDWIGDDGHGDAVLLMRVRGDFKQGGNRKVVVGVVAVWRSGVALFQFHENIAAALCFLHQQRGVIRLW